MDDAGRFRPTAALPKEAPPPPPPAAAAAFEVPGALLDRFEAWLDALEEEEEEEEVVAALEEAL